MYKASILKHSILACALVLSILANQHAQGQLHPIDADEAAHIALEHLAGTVIKVQRERDLGISIFEVKIRTDSGLLYVVDVATDNGRVLRVVRDD